MKFSDFHHFQLKSAIFRENQLFAKSALSGQLLSWQRREDAVQATAGGPRLGHAPRVRAHRKKICRSGTGSAPPSLQLRFRARQPPPTSVETFEEL